MADTIKDLQSKIVVLVADQLQVDAAAIQPAQSLTDLGADEIDHIELVMRCEEQFGLLISDEEAEQLTTVDAFSSYISSKK